MFGYVTKRKVEISAQATESVEDTDQSTPTEMEVYEAFIVELKREEVKIHNLDTKRSKQVRIQFLYKEKEHRQQEKFLLLIHQECKN